MAEKLGIDKLKLVLGLGFSFGEQIGLALEDGKINFADLPGFIGVFAQVQPVIAEGKEALAQALDLDAEERTELNAWAQAEFDIANDAVEAKVEAALDLAISVLVAYGVFKPKTA
jgi:hypothetical protein